MPPPSHTHSKKVITAESRVEQTALGSNSLSLTGQESSLSLSFFSCTMGIIIPHFLRTTGRLTSVCADVVKGNVRHTPGAQVPDGRSMEAGVRAWGGHRGCICFAVRPWPLKGVQKKAFSDMHMLLCPGNEPVGTDSKSPSHASLQGSNFRFTLACPIPFTANPSEPL